MLSELCHFRQYCFAQGFIQASWLKRPVKGAYTTNVSSSIYRRVRAYNVDKGRCKKSRQNVGFCGKQLLAYIFSRHLCKTLGACKIRWVLHSEYHKEKESGQTIVPVNNG